MGFTCVVVIWNTSQSPDHLRLLLLMVDGQRKIIALVCKCLWRVRNNHDDPPFRAVRMLASCLFLMHHDNAVKEFRLKKDRRCRVVCICHKI